MEQVTTRPFWHHLLQADLFIRKQLEFTSDRALGHFTPTFQMMPFWIWNGDLVVEVGTAGQGHPMLGTFDATFWGPNLPALNNNLGMRELFAPDGLMSCCWRGSWSCRSNRADPQPCDNALKSLHKDGIA
eukprot:1156965-Pelagomonas_calceolata.AAC.4